MKLTYGTADTRGYCESAGLSRGFRNALLLCGAIYAAVFGVGCWAEWW